MIRTSDGDDDDTTNADADADSNSYTRELRNSELASCRRSFLAFFLMILLFKT